jgi:hypothetical protein
MSAVRQTAPTPGHCELAKQLASRRRIDDDLCRIAADGEQEDDGSERSGTLGHEQCLSG